MSEYVFHTVPLSAFDSLPRPVSKHDHSSPELSRVERPDRRRRDDRDDDDDDTDDGKVTVPSSSFQTSEESEISMATTFKQVKSEWDAALAEKRREMPHATSMAPIIAAVVKENPQLRERLVAAANQPKPIPATNAKTESYRRVKSEWDAALAAKRESNPRLSWDQVVAAVCKENRTLRERLVDAANAR